MMKLLLQVVFWNILNVLLVWLLLKCSVFITCLQQSVLEFEKHSEHFPLLNLLVASSFLFFSIVFPPINCPFSLKKSIAYSQALRLKQICSTNGEYEKHTKNLKKQLIKKGYPETLVNEEIQKATNQDRTGLLNKEKTETANHLTLCLTYSKTLPNITIVLEKHWHILNMNPELK